MFDSGLRIEETINLGVENIDSKRMLINIYKTKGLKFRSTILGVTTLNTLRGYNKIYNPKDYLFEGQFGEKYS